MQLTAHIVCHKHIFHGSWDQNESEVIHFKLWKIHAQGVDKKIHIHQWQWSRTESQHLI